MLWAHLEDVKGALGPFEAWWQPPEKIGGRNPLTSPSGALLRKTFVFDGAVARSLDPQC